MPQQQQQFGGQREMSLQELIEYRAHVQGVLERMEEEYEKLQKNNLPYKLIEYDASLQRLIDALEQTISQNDYSEELHQK